MYKCWTDTLTQIIISNLNPHCTMSNSSLLPTYNTNPKSSDLMFKFSTISYLISQPLASHIPSQSQHMFGARVVYLTIIWIHRLMSQSLGFYLNQSLGFYFISTTQNIYIFLPAAPTTLWDPWVDVLGVIHCFILRSVYGPFWTQRTFTKCFLKKNQVEQQKPGFCFLSVFHTCYQEMALNYSIFYLKKDL